MYCQKCRTPLKTDSSLDDLNPAAFDLLVGSGSKTERSAAYNHSLTYPHERKERYERAIKQTQSPLSRRTIPPPKPQDGNPAMSFIEITDSQIVPAEASHHGHPQQDQLSQAKGNGTHDNEPPLSWHLHRHERLFSILSAHSDIDHPICTECSSMLLTSLNAKLATATRERDAYASFLKTLQQASAKHKGEEEPVQKELATLQEAEDAAFADLVKLEEQKRELENELADLEEENKQLEKEEERFWQSRNQFNEQQHELETELASLHQKYAHDQKQLERLQRSNVYNDTFFISHDGSFGTINGLRLGRLPTQNVEWAEINAAWGQTLLLLQTLAERLSFSFHGYKLRPLGSTSRIEKIEYPQQAPDATQTTAARATSNPSNSPAKVTHLDLFSSGDMSLGRMLTARRFDAAMVAFLDCLSQLGSHVERTTSASRDTSRPTPSRTPSTALRKGETRPMEMPYLMEGDKIWARDRPPNEAVSIKIGFGLNQDEDFTKACKYVLTCCKYLLAHVSNLDNSKPSQT
ncbi:Vacuolar protein sorting-associated protein atg6 [Neophaeococcomyces mojaviensis]|uniref:Vacuolar protein sorting-associated protein atg6 n=1 Tax=Neophaeococcomyces mojaviensis TaxID=3383035 RepID=A0ACC3AEH1_9EURO|nr:Vacuolar protein sorting-associated protein atg6 [Knufia sp. JES_112]